MHSLPEPKDTPGPVVSRRSFAAAGVAGIAALASGPPAIHSRRAAHDLVIRGGLVFDGSGAPGAARDVAVSAGRITGVAPRIEERGTNEIDARGLACRPASSTSIRTATDRCPRTARRVAWSGRGSRRSSSARMVVAWRASREPSVRTLASLEALRPSVNVASMIGLGTVRGAVVGKTDRPATADELRRWSRWSSARSSEGACGASSGLEYTPGAFASREELIALCRPLAARRLPYATHMRNEDDRLLDSIDESIAVARGAGCPLQISHLKTQGPRNWAKLDAVFARIERRRARRARRRVRPISVHRVPDGPHQSLSGLEPRRRHRGVPRATRRRSDGATDPPRDAGEGRADRRVGQRA